ncbi:hypothetical protein Tco_0183529 [Tanacetum coccineum]
MVIDKSWTRLGRHEKAFYTGLKKFVEDCKSLVDSAGNIKCPCKSCRLVLWVSIKNLSRHITNYGFDPSYKTWIHHGEPDLPPPPPIIRQPLMSDMTTCLNDLSYIPLNNEQNEPTQGDIGETSNEPPQAKRNEFEELYASANEELYPGCNYVTRLDFMSKFTYFKVNGKLTDSIFNKMLEFFQNVFPTNKGFKLPPSYYAIKKTFKMIELGYESIHACINDCFLFWCDDNKDVHFCLVCNTSRWKDSKTPGKKVPKKVLRYFSIIPRLQRLYNSSHTAKEMTWHATGKCTKSGSSGDEVVLVVADLVAAVVMRSNGDGVAVRSGDGDDGGSADGRSREVVVLGGLWHGYWCGVASVVRRVWWRRGNAVLREKIFSGGRKHGGAGKINE